MTDMLACTFTIRGGPVDGFRIEAEASHWPPPERLYGPDLHRSAYGLYERIGATVDPPYRAVYAPRADDDYARVANGHIRAKERQLLEEQDEQQRDSFLRKLLGESE